jgi:hypothetical protein
MYEAFKVFGLSDTLVGIKVTVFWGRRRLFLLRAECGVIYGDFARNNFYSATNKTEMRLCL